MSSEDLAIMLDNGHPLKPDWELVKYSQGSVRHRFYPPDLSLNAEMSPVELAEAFIQGQAAKIVSATEAKGKSDNAKYQAAQDARIAGATEALMKIADIPEVQALIDSPSDENALALVAAIDGKDCR